MKKAYLRATDNIFTEQKNNIPEDIEKIYCEHCSGYTILCNRLELQKLLDETQKDDFIWVYSMDRITTSFYKIIYFIDQILQKEATIFFYKENLTFSNKNNSFIYIFYKLFFTFSEQEYKIKKEAQQIGIEKAKARGIYKGRVFILKPEQADELRRIYAETRIPVTQLAKQFHISRASCYRYLKNANHIKGEQ